MNAVSFLVMVHRYPEISVMGVCCTTQALTLGTGATASGVHRSEESYTLRFVGLEQSHPEMVGWDPRAGLARASIEKNRRLLDVKEVDPQGRRSRPWPGGSAG